ncbi:unnamed protein product [Discula destructiva]
MIGKPEEKLTNVLGTTEDDVLIIDNMHMIYLGVREDRSKSPAAAFFGTLVNSLEDRNGCVILVGDADGVQEMYDADRSGLRAKFPLEFAFRLRDMDSEKLGQVLQSMLNEKNVFLAEGAMDASHEVSGKGQKQAKLC